jgi:hypothetical protein
MSIRHKGIYRVTLKSPIPDGVAWETFAYWNGEHWRHVAHTKGDTGPRIPESEMLEVGNYAGADDYNPGEKA